MSLTQSQKSEVEEILQKYGRAYRMKDLKTMLALFSPGITGFGSGPDEVILDRQSFIRQIRRDMSQADIDAVVFTGTKISGEGRIAWVTTASSFTFTAGRQKKQTLQGRSTMVLRNTGSRWVIEQIHFSLPYGEQSPGQSFPGT